MDELVRNIKAKHREVLQAKLLINSVEECALRDLPDSTQLKVNTILDNNFFNKLLNLDRDNSEVTVTESDTISELINPTLTDVEKALLKEAVERDLHKVCKDLRRLNSSTLGRRLEKVNDDEKCEALLNKCDQLKHCINDLTISKDKLIETKISEQYGIINEVASDLGGEIMNVYDEARKLVGEMDEEIYSQNTLDASKKWAQILEVKIDETKAKINRLECALDDYKSVDTSRFHKLMEEYKKIQTKINRKKWALEQIALNSST